MPKALPATAGLCFLFVLGAPATGFRPPEMTKFDARTLDAGLPGLWTMASAAAAPRAVAAGADSFDFHYAISLIGLPIGTAQIKGTLGPATYRIEASGRLTGLAGVIISTKGAATATGTLSGERLDPANFAATAANAAYTLTIRMAIVKGVAKAVDISPPYESKPDRIPLTDADRRGILDPLSSFVMPVSGGGDPIGPEACNRTLPVFDGGVRFDVALAYTGRREVTSAAYTGPVAVCSARYRPIAGYRSERPVNRFMMNNKEMEVWLAPVGKTRFVAPLRASILSMVGTTLIEATSFGVAMGSKAAATAPTTTTAAEPSPSGPPQ